MRKLTFALAILMLFVVGPDQTLAKPDNEPNRTEPAPAPPPQPPSSEGGVGDFSRRLRGRWGPRRGPGGLSGLGGFEETVDPKSEPRRGMGDVPPEVANQPARSNNARTTVHQPTVEELRARVQELESVRYGNVPPVSSTQAAEEDVKRLRAQLEQMRSHRELVNRREARRLRDRMEEFGRRWHRAAEAMAGGPDEVSRTEWRRIATEVLIGEVPETTFVPEPKPEPKPEDKDEGGYLDFGEEPITEEDVPAAPAPKPEEIVKPEQISEAFVKLYEAIKSGKKPKNMGIKEWVVLLDEYYSDISDLHADAATTMRKLDKKRARELAELAKALKAAEEQFERAQELEKTLDGEQMRMVNKDLAWRKHEAELAAARVRLQDAERLEKERKGEKTVRVPVGGYSGAVGEAFLVIASKLADAFRELDVQGHGPAPPSEVLADEGLPLPGWMGEEFAGNDHEHRMLAKLKNYRHWLVRARMQIAACEKYIKNQDRDRVREERAVLEKVDRDAGSLHNPARVRARRARLRKLIEHLNTTRANRVARRRQMFERDAARYKKLLEQELKRYETMGSE